MALDVNRTDRSNFHMLSMGGQPSRFAADHAFLVVSLDEPSTRAAAMVLERIGQGILPSLQSHFAAVQLRDTSTVAIPNPLLERIPDSLPAAARAVWGQASAVTHACDLVIVVVRTIEAQDDLGDLEMKAKQVKVSLDTDGLVAQLVILAAFVFPPAGLDLTLLRQLATMNRPPALPASRPMPVYSPTELVLPPFVLDLTPPRGAARRELAPEGLADFLETFSEQICKDLLSLSLPPDRTHLIGVSALEVPNRDERDYLQLRAQHRWMLELGERPPQPRGRGAPPYTQVKRAVSRIDKAFQANFASQRTRVKTIWRRSESEIGTWLKPARLGRLPLEDQFQVIAAVNAELYQPQVGWRDRILGDLSSFESEANPRSRSGQEATASSRRDPLATTGLLHQASSPFRQAIDEEIYRVLSDNFGGLLMIETALQEFITHREKKLRDHRWRHTRQTAVPTEPSLMLDTDELRERQPQSRPGPARTVLVWLSLLMLASVYIAMSLPGWASPDPLLDDRLGPYAGRVTRGLFYAGLIAAAITIWQVVRLVKVVLVRRQLTELPQVQLCERVTRWFEWWQNTGLAERLLQDARDALEEVRALRNLLYQLQQHLEVETTEALARLKRDAFPSRLGHSDNEIDRLWKLVKDRDLEWFLEALGDKAQSRDSLAVGRSLTGFLHSLALSAGHSVEADGLLATLSQRAVQDTVGFQLQDSLDHRVADPWATLQDMLLRAFPGGTRPVGLWLAADPSLEIAQVAASKPMHVVERADPSRATLVFVTVGDSVAHISADRQP